MNADEIKAMDEQIKKGFEDLKKENDRRLAEIEKKGHARADFDEVIAKQNKHIDDLEAKFEDLDKKAGRPALEAKEVKIEEERKRKEVFARYLRKGDRKMSEEDRDLLVKTGFSVATDSEGGYAVPEELDRTIQKIAMAQNPMRQLCKVITAGVGYHSLADIGGEAVEWVDEDDARSEQTGASIADMVPKFGDMATDLRATQDVLDDVFFDLEAWIAEQMARGFAKAEDLAFVSGNGTKKPKGILAYNLATTDDDSRTFGEIQKVLSGADGDFDGDSILNLIYAFRDEYLQNASFVMKGTTLASTRKIKDGNGNYLWAPGLGGEPATLCGYPVYKDANMETVAADAKAIMLGDFKRAYGIVDVKGIRMIRDPYTVTPKVKFAGTKRVGGGLLDSLAVKILVTGD